MSIEASMVNYYADRAKEYERIYHKPERQDDLRQLRNFVERTFAGADVFELSMAILIRFGGWMTAARMRCSRIFRQIQSCSPVLRV